MSEAVVKRAAVVTGGSRGIGRAICVALAKQGCNVVVNYCHGVDAAAETVAQCTTLGVQAVAVQADVSTAEGCKKLFEEAVNAFGRVDILVNNAGVTRDNLILRLPAGWSVSALAGSSTSAAWWPCGAMRARPTTPPARQASSV